MSAPTTPPVPQPRAAERLRCQWTPGTASEPPPCWRATAPANARLDLAFATLRRYGIAAMPGYGHDRDSGRREVADEVARRWPQGSGWYALWTRADGQACLDAAGSLVAPLTVLHHPAAGAAVVAALTDAGLVVTRRGPDRVVVTAEAT